MNVNKNQNQNYEDSEMEVQKLLDAIAEVDTYRGSRMNVVVLNGLIIEQTKRTYKV